MSNDQAYAALGALCDDAVEVSRLLEALLFVADAPVEVTALAGTLGCPQDAIAAGLSVLAERVQQGGLRLQQFRDSVQLVTAPTAAPFVER